MYTNVMDASDLIQTIDFCRSRLPVSAAKDLFRFESIPLAVLKAISSIGIKTPKLDRVIDLYYENFPLKYFTESSCCSNATGEICVNYFLKWFETHGSEEASPDIYLQTGIDLTEETRIAYMFCRTLHAFDVDRSSDLDKVVGNIFFENQIRNIPGQRNGDSLKFFYMYAGVEYPLPDQVLRKFINTVIKKNLGVKECHKLIEHAAQVLEFDISENAKELLEKLIWSYQLAQKKLRIAWHESEEIRPGHGVFLYDKDRNDSRVNDNNVVAYIEGYSLNQCLSNGGNLPLKGYCIRPDEITTSEIIDEIKLKIEEIMKLTMPPPKLEIIPNRIFTDLNC